METPLYVTKVEWLDDEDGQPRLKSHFEVTPDDPILISDFISNTIGNLNVTQVTILPLDPDRQPNAEAMFALAQNQSGLFEGKVW